MESSTGDLREKRSQAKAQKISEIMKECTFRPNAGKSTRRRNTSQFLNDQRNLYMMSKINLLKMIEEAHKKEIENCKEKPSISQNSKDILNKKNSTELCKRLCPKESTKSSPIKVTTNEIIESKKLTEEESNIVNRLCKDKKHKELCQNMKSPIKKECRLVSDQHVVNKFMKEFALCISKLNINIINSPYVDYEVMKQILIGMRFINTNSANDKAMKEVDQLFKKIFVTLADNEKNKVHINKLKTFIASILNIQLHDSDTFRISKEYKQLYLWRKVNTEARKDCTNKKQNKQRVKAGTSQAEIIVNSPGYCSHEESPNKPKYIKKCSFVAKKGIKETEKEVPILKIEVDIGGKAETISIFKGDNIELLVKGFIEKHSKINLLKIDLSDSAVKVLEDIAKRNIDKILK